MRPARLLLIAALVAPLARAQDDPEARLRATLSAERLGAFHARLTREPHVAGTPESRTVAAEIERALAAMGLATEVRSYDVYLSYPTKIAIRLTRPERLELPVTESADPRDPDTANPKLTPGFVAYSASGHVTAPVVYVNYGLPADYAALETKGVALRGRIALARYGKVHRAVKVHAAEERGAVGILIYSDPADDGAGQGEVWPKGPWRAPHFVQRGNAKYSWFWHGDPLTPGVAATAEAKRLDPRTAPTLPKIPAAVLSASAGLQIRSRLNADGPGPAVIEMDVAMTNGLRPIYDVIARIEGKEEPDREVILGTHHDAWTFGGVDPGSAAASVLELARAFSELRKSGWQPRRSILFAFWDAEEYGLIGSTEYAEDRGAELRERAVAYVNTDYYLAGRLEAGGSASLRDLMESVAGEKLDLAPLGSGADFVPFQDHLGVPALSIEYGIPGSYGSYHSAYDTRQWMQSYGDRDWAQGVKLAELLGGTLLRLASAAVLPFHFTRTAEALAGYLDQLEAKNRESGSRLAEPGLGSTRARLAALAEAASAFEATSSRAASLAPAVQREINDRLLRAETGFAQPAGESWYRHVVYGWDIYSLYSGDTLPTLRAAITRADAAGFARERDRLEQALASATSELTAATALSTAQTSRRWCDELPRAAYAPLERVPVSDSWFQVYRVSPGVFAIYEPYQFQEVISYLIVGSERAILFDTGMGISRIHPVVSELTRLPLRVVNSHTHFDHVGGNADFDTVLGMDTTFTRRSAEGLPHAAVQGEVAPEALCRALPEGVVAESYRIRPFQISGLLKDGERLDLGDRTLEVLSVPGHTPDAIALLDRAAGLLWTGDTFYEGPIWLFVPETDFEAYAASVERLAQLVPQLRLLLPAHNTPVAAPRRLEQLKAAVAAIRAGTAKSHPETEARVEYEFEGFSLLLKSAVR